MVSVQYRYACARWISSSRLLGSWVSGYRPSVAFITALLPIVVSLPVLLLLLPVGAWADLDDPPSPSDDLPTSAADRGRDEANSTDSETTDLLIRGAPFYQPLQDLPQSASVISNTQALEVGANSFVETMGSIPGLAYSGGTSRPRFFLIRGIGELEQYQGSPNPSVATIIDDVDVSGLGLVTPLFDMDHIEVLKGPQGIQYGANGLAGAISLRSSDPTPYTTGQAEISTGNDDLFGGGAAVGGAVPGTDRRLQVRVSAFQQYSNGFRDNAFYGSDNTNKRDEAVARAKVRYEATQELTLDFAAWVADANNGYDAFSIDNSLTTESDRPGEDDLLLKASSFTATTRINRTIKAANLVTVSDAQQTYSYDGDWGNNPFWSPYDPYDYFSSTSRSRTTVGNELRLYSDDPAYLHGESYRWTVGAFGQHLAENTYTAQFSNGLPYDTLDSDYDATTGALFGQTEFPLSPGTSITSGLRLERRTTDYSDTNDASFTPGYSMVGGSVSLAHDLTKTTRWYSTVSRGFKGGGFNPGPTVPEDRRIYNPEYLWNFESGIKGRWLKNKVNTNLSLFHNQRYDQQLKLAYQTDPTDPLTFTYITESSGRGKSSGLELDTSAQIFQPVNIYAVGALMQSEFLSVPKEDEAVLGRSFSYAPNWTYAVGTRATISSDLFFRVEVTGKDRFYFDDSHNQQSNPYSLLNASLGYERDTWNVTLWGRNLCNQIYAVRGFYFGDEPPDFPDKLYIQRGDPRTFGVTFRYKF